MLRRLLLSVVLGGLWSSAAFAQWDPGMTADLGRGMGQIALSQSILSGTRRLGSDAAIANGARAPRSVTQHAVTLTYTPDPRVSEQMRQSVINTLSQQNPGLRERLGGALRSGAILSLFDRFMGLHGFSSRNVADDMAMQLLISWEIATGNVASAAQIQGADSQVRGVFLSTPQLRATTNVQRQQLAESIAYQIVIGSAASRQLERAGDQAQLAQLRASAQGILRERGIDLSRLQLTAQGFVRN